ncbi:hypothetical protein D3C81_2316160 [compost metagenome]
MLLLEKSELAKSFARIEESQNMLLACIGGPADFNHTVRKNEQGIRLSALLEHRLALVQEAEAGTR